MKLKIEQNEERRNKNKEGLKRERRKWKNEKENNGNIQVSKKRIKHVGTGERGINGNRSLCKNVAYIGLHI
jgi:hypothetical protein